MYDAITIAVALAVADAVAQFIICNLQFAAAICWPNFLQVMGVPFKDGVNQERDAAAYHEALTALAEREAQHRQLAAIRLELERLRLLLERVSKRERLKRESKLCPSCTTATNAYA